jgi:hypothetical protein
VLGLVGDAAGAGAPGAADGPLRGWFAEPAIDGYRWEDGFAPDTGLLDRARSPRDTAARLAEIAAARSRPPAVDLAGAVLLDAHDENVERDGPGR